MVDFYQSTPVPPVLVTSVRIVFYIYEWQYWYIILVIYLDSSCII
jgi:hypothetical protein